MAFSYDIIVIGAGAAGLMCAAQAGKRGCHVWLIDHASKIGEKIRISGGGRCNFTNIYTSPDNFLSKNPHFCKSALQQYTQQDFINLVRKHKIAYHEKTLGQLFCDGSSKQIIDMLLTECHEAAVNITLQTKVENIKTIESGYQVTTSQGQYSCSSLVIATGGLSIPKIGATKFGYDIAKQFGLKLVPTRAALVPLTFQNNLLEKCKNLTGVSVDARVAYEKTSFAEGLLFTHRGLSGPSILQISSYWKEQSPLHIDLKPAMDVFSFLKQRKIDTPKQEIQTILFDILPKRLVQSICEDALLSGNIADLSYDKINLIAQSIKEWTVEPNGTEGYRTAEVTLGGVDTNELSSKTMACKKHPNLFFIGEVVDVTGHLGGFNFQWAWSSGYVAGQHA